MEPSQKGPAWSRRSDSHLSLIFRVTLVKDCQKSSSVSLSATVSLTTEIRYSQGTPLHVSAASESRGSLFLLP